MKTIKIGFLALVVFNAASIFAYEGDMGAGWSCGIFADATSYNGYYDVTGYYDDHDQSADYLEAQANGRYEAMNCTLVGPANYEWAAADDWTDGGGTEWSNG